MEYEVNPKFASNTADIYKTSWKAYFKSGLGSPAIVYGNTIEEAQKNALAYYRKNCTLLSKMPISKIVDHVELVG